MYKITIEGPGMELVTFEYEHIDIDEHRMVRDVTGVGKVHRRLEPTGQTRLIVSAWSGAEEWVDTEAWTEPV